MAKLPQALDMPAPRAANPSGAALDFGSLDNALQGVAQQIQRVDQARRQADDEEAVRVVEEARQTYALKAAERAYGYDGRQPGYAEAELKAFDDEFAALTDRADLPDGVRMAVGRQVRDLRTRTGAQVIATEAQARGQRAAADRDAAEQAEAVRVLMAIDTAFDEKEDARRQDWDGISAGFTDGLRGDWRETSEAAMEGLAPGVLDRLRPMVLSREASLMARGLQVEDESRDARTLTTVTEGLTGLVNRIARDPSLMNRFDAEIAPLLEIAPAHLRDKLKTETRSEGMTRAAESRIEAGDYEAVEADIKAGRFDALDPARVQRLRDMVVSTRANGIVTSAQEQADFEAAAAADLRNILKGGQPDPVILAQARRIGGETLASKIGIDRTAAQNVRPLMARLRTLTPQQAQAELERMTENAGTAAGARSLELAREMIDQDRALRADPAKHAATPIGPGDSAAEAVQARLRAFSEAPSEQTAQAYASASWIAQEASSVPLIQRRVLMSDTAEAWVAGVDANGAPDSGLRDLAGRVALFGPGFRPQVLRELSMAGLKPADMGALVHYTASPARLAAYVQARGKRPNELAPEKDDRDQVDRELNRAMEPWVRAIGSRDGAAAAIEAARVTAYAAVGRGERPRDAVRSATGPIVDGYDYEGTFAVPKSAGVNSGRVRRHLAGRVGLLVREGGARLATPPGEGAPEQRRRIYADIVRNHGQWRNTADGRGVELVTPNARGDGWVRVRTDGGHDVQLTWAQAEQEGR